MIPENHLARRESWVQAHLPPRLRLTSLETPGTSSPKNHLARRESWGSGASAAEVTPYFSRNVWHFLLRALSKLETGQRLNPTIETLVRYADAVGKRLVVSLANG